MLLRDHRCCTCRVCLSCRLNNKALTDALHGDAMAMLMAMHQTNPMLAGAGANFNAMRPSPVLPPLSLPPKVPQVHAGRQPGQPTPEQMMMANAEISRCGSSGLVCVACLADAAPFPLQELCWPDTPAVVWRGRVGMTGGLCALAAQLLP